jgi:hypothetical protein
MSNDVVKKDPTSVDNFAGWEDGVEGDDQPQSAGLIQGSLVKFTNEAMWVTRDGAELPADLELVAVDVGRVVQKWQDQQPVETIILQPHQKFPDIGEMNKKTPREEWVEGPDKKPRGPWQAQHILYLVDLATMDKYTFPTGTTGGRIAIRDLRDKLVWIRRLRGPNVYPIILLADTFMRTRWAGPGGGRQRPHFKIIRWVRLGGEGGEVEALPPPSPQALDQSAKPVEKPAQPRMPESELPLTTVKEPSLQEELNDDLPEDLKASPAESKPEITTSMIYRGYDVDPHSWIISKDGKEVHRADNEDAACAWIDDQRKRAFGQKKPTKTSAKKPPPKRRPNILEAG